MADPTTDAPGIDLGPATTALAELVRALPDAALPGPTPCAGRTVADLLDHVDGLCLAFTGAAAKAPLDPDGQEPDGARLGDDWRTRIPERLDALAAAWRDPEAWTGMTAAGGVDLPGEVCGLVALDEVVVHGWDLAVATGIALDLDDATLAAVHGFVAGFEPPDDAPDDGSLFGPPVAVPDDAPLLDRLLGLTGRDPAWSPT